MTGMEMWEAAYEEWVLESGDEASLKDAFRAGWEARKWRAEYWD